MQISKWIKRFFRAGIWIWFFYWIAQIFAGDLGASPALKLNHEIGELVLVLLSFNLVLGRFWASERRFLGVSTYLFLTAHVFFYFVNEGFEAKAFVQVVTKPYLIFAFLAFLILTALAVTSNNFSVRRLGGKRWKRVHRLVYVAQIALFGHLLLIEKADLQKYSLWLGSLALVQVFRWIKMRRRLRETALIPK